LRRLVGRWLQEHELHPPEIRIDVISVLVPAGGGQPTIEHLRSVG
jgi:putative endonuclease